MRYNSSMHTDLTDEELIRLVQDGDEDAFAQLASRHSSKIWHLVVLSSRQIRDAEEIFQDIWIAVWRNIGGLRQISSFGAWLRKIAYTACRRYYSPGRHEGGEILQTAEQLAETLDRDAHVRFREAELRAAVTEAVHHLPERLRTVAVLYYLEMWTVAEIAAELNLAVGTVKTRLRDIRARLRKEFGVQDVQRRTPMTSEKENRTPSQHTHKIIGVGDAGGSFIKHMIATGITDVEFCAVNTDRDALDTCQGATRIQIGVQTTRGLGTDGNPELGKSAAEEDMETLDAITADTKLVFITAGIGGGTGTGAAPIIAARAREQGALTIGIVTRPFDAEEQSRHQHAANGLHELQEHTDALIVIPNQRLLDAQPGMAEALRLSNDTVCRAVECILELTLQPEGEINVDFTDVQSILKDAGTVLMGIGKAAGENRGQLAMQNAIASPLMDGKTVQNASGMIVRITAPPDFVMQELDAAMKLIQDEAPDAQIIFGLVYADEPETAVTATLLAAGAPNPISGPAAPVSTQKGTSPANGGTHTSSTTDSEFVHLHNHSEYSMLDGACRISHMIEWAVENSVPALALTDHGNMFGAWEFYNKATEAGINPIIGCEVYVARGSRVAQLQESTEPYHLTLLAEDAIGYRNLLELVSLGYTEGFNRLPCIDLDILRQHHSGIIALTGCVQAQLPQLLCANQRDAALHHLKTLIEIMGPRNLYVELQNHYLPEELKAYPLMRQLATEFNLPIVGTNDCHYLRKSDYRTQHILRCIHERKTVNDTHTPSADNHYYFKSVDEMREVLKEYPPEAISNTLEIANRCNLELESDQDPMPQYEIPHGYTHDSYLKQVCYQRLREKCGILSEPLRHRLDYELNVIAQGGHANYFLIVADYVNYAHTHGYPLSARGSAASSLVLYALDVISFNPMEHGCLFERFLNLERNTLPDIDIDFADQAREHVIQYLVKKYGEDSVGKVATFATLGAKAAIRDVGRALDLPQQSLDKLTDLLPLNPRTTLEETLERVPEFRTLAELPENRELIEISKAVEGMKRHVSCHASAIVVSQGPLTNYVPLFKDRHDRIATQFEGTTVETLGIVKFDSLGLRSFTQLHDCLRRIEENHDVEIKLEDIPFDDNRVYSLVSQGLIAGLFQLGGSPGLHRVVTALKPRNFEELSAIPALYRPGPIENGDLQTYIDRKNGGHPVTYVHPSLTAILKSTYGLCIYQEQVMQIAHDTAGFTLAEADRFRHAISRKNKTAYPTHREQFIAGVLKNGNLAESEAQEVYEWLESVGEYAFNKSHTVAYSMVAYRMAYLKTHYPHEFMAVLINSAENDPETIDRYQEEYQKLADFLNTTPNLKIAP